MREWEIWKDARAPGLISAQNTREEPARWHLLRGVSGIYLFCIISRNPWKWPGELHQLHSLPFSANTLCVCVSLATLCAIRAASVITEYSSRLLLCSETTMRLATRPLYTQKFDSANPKGLRMLWPRQMLPRFFTSSLWCGKLSCVLLEYICIWARLGCDKQPPPRSCASLSLARRWTLLNKKVFKRKNFLTFFLNNNFVKKKNNIICCGVEKYRYAVHFFLLRVVYFNLMEK